MDARERTGPIALLATGLVLLAVIGWIDSGELGALGFFLAHAIGLVFGVGMGLIACYVTAWLMGITFGFLSTSVLKLAGIFAFTSALGSIHYPLSSLVTFVLYLGLLMWLFELNLLEAFVFAVVLFVIHLLAMVVILTAVLTVLAPAL